MPEFPDLTVYIDSLEARITGQILERIRVVSPFLLRTVEPPLAEAEGRIVMGVRRRLLPREGDGISRGRGRARQVPEALSGVRLTGPAHCLCRKRVQLLRCLPDGRKLLADRALSRLLKGDWPRTREELEEMRGK